MFAYIVHVHIFVFLLFLFFSKRGEALPGEDIRLLGDLPQALQEDVGMEEFNDLLSNINFLKHSDVSFIRQLSVCTHTYLFAPGDMIIYHGDIGMEMYCIQKGYVEVSLNAINDKFLLI